MPSRPSSQKQLFPVSENSGKTSQAQTLASSAGEWITAYIDGGARGNPGPAGYGVRVTGSAGQVLDEISKFLGRGTNNFAEYSALLAALDYSLQHGHKKLKVFSDSELLVKQMKGEYKVKSPDLRPLYDEARARIRKLESFSIQHLRREQNRDADRLANQAMDAGKKPRF